MKHNLMLLMTSMLLILHIQMYKLNIFFYIYLYQPNINALLVLQKLLISQKLGW